MYDILIGIPSVIYFRNGQYDQPYRYDILVRILITLWKNILGIPLSVG